MKINELEKITKRIKKKNDSHWIAKDMLKKFGQLELKDGNIKRKLERQLECCSKLEIYSNDEIRTWFCGQKTCRVCNSIRMAKLLGIYGEQIDQFDFKYHLTLTMQSAECQLYKDDDGLYKYREIDSIDLIKVRINDMFKFFHNSMLCKTAIYKKLSKTVNFIRTWEVTFNKFNKVHPHFHMLLVGNDEDDIKTLGNLIINYWLKWWKRKKVKAVSAAQKLEPIRKTILENFKYCLKINDIKNANAFKIIEIIRATESRHLFTQRGFMSEKKMKQINEAKIENIENTKLNNIEDAFVREYYLYNEEIQSYCSHQTGEILQPDEKKKTTKRKIILT